MDESFVEHLTARPKAETMIRSARDVAHTMVGAPPEARNLGMGASGLSGLFRRKLDAYERRVAAERRGSK